MKLLLKGLIICFFINFITNINVNALEEQERLESQLQEIGIEDSYSQNIADYVYYYVLDDEKIEEVVQRGEKIASTVENKSSLTDFKFSDLMSIYNDFNFITKTLNLKLSFNLRDKSIEIKEKNDNTVLIKANLEQISDYYNNYVDDFTQDGIMTIVKEEKKQKEDVACVATVDEVHSNNKNTKIVAEYNKGNLAKSNHEENKEGALKKSENESIVVKGDEGVKSIEGEKYLNTQNLNAENKKNDLSSKNKNNLSKNNQLQNNNSSKKEEMPVTEDSSQISNLFNVSNLPQSKNLSKENKGNNVNNEVNLNEEEKSITYGSNINEIKESSNDDKYINEDKKAMADILNSEETNEVMNHLVYTKDNIDTLLWIAVIIIALIGVLVSAKRLIRG